MRTTFLIALVAGVLAAPSAASACTIAAKSAKERVDGATLAVYGKVVSRTEIAGGDVNDPETAYRYRFRVLETYKGPVRRRMTLIGGTEESLCEAGLLRIGQRFGLTLDKRRGPWRINIAHFITRAELRSVRRPKRD